MTKIDEAVRGKTYTEKEYNLLLKRTLKQDEKIEKLKFQQKTIIETLETAVLKLPSIKAPRKIKPTLKFKEETVSLDLSDFQLGSVVTTEGTGGLCKYNKKEFLKRADKLTQSIYEIIEIQRRGGIPINKLNIHLLGDVVQGEEIFKGQAFYLDAPLVEQVFQLGHEVVTRILIPLAQLFPEIDIFCIPGNHGRQSLKSHRTTNWDYIAYIFFKLLMANIKNVRFFISATSFMLYEMYPSQIHGLIHGNQARGWMGIPYYGVDRLHKNLTSLAGVYISYFHYGHHHQPALIDLHIGKKIGNGSFEGGSEYSVNDLITANTPQQFMCGINQKGITWEYWLRLADYPRLKPDEAGIYTTIMETPKQ